jgi:FKBP-type peptidyl-prolyl cis-trans isomerase FkpA
MNKILAAILTFSCAAGVNAAELKTIHQKTLYSIGLKLAEDGKGYALKANEIDYVIEGLKDGLKGKSKVSLEAHRQKIALLKTERSTAIQKNFIINAAKEKGAKRMPSGLVYKEIKKGSGKSPKATDTVRAHYHGTFVDGKVFDSSVQKKRPFTAPLNRVIPCWTEGMQLMKVGGKARLVCPSNIAYGPHGRGGIPGGATLIFDVELLAVNP